MSPNARLALAAALLGLLAVLCTNLSVDSGRYSPASAVSALLIPSAQAREATAPVAAEDADLKEFERFLTRNPGTLLGVAALPIILLLTIVARRRHCLVFSILIGAVAGAACETIPGIVPIASPVLARLAQSAAAALVAVLVALIFDLMFFIARLSRRLILGKPLGGPDPLREWFRDAILVQRWAPPGERTQEVDHAVARWHIALVTGAGALVATVLIQGHFVAGLHEHFTASGFLTTSVILIAALYILEPVRERILNFADPRHHHAGAQDSLVRTLINSPQRGWLFSIAAVVGALLVQVLIIGLEEAIQKAQPLELLRLAFSGLGPVPIAYFLTAALQKRLELERAIRGTTVFVALFIFAFLLAAGAIASTFAGGAASYFVQTFLGSEVARFTIVPLVGIAAGLIACVVLFWLSLGVALLLGFLFNGLSVWLIQILWPQIRGLSPLAYLALAIVIETIIESMLTAPFMVWTQEPGQSGETIRSLVTEPIATSAGWLVGFWLSGISGVLETYQKERPELFPNLKTS